MSVSSMGLDFGFRCVLLLLIVRLLLGSVALVFLNFEFATPVNCPHSVVNRSGCLCPWHICKIILFLNHGIELFRRGCMFQLDLFKEVKEKIYEQCLTPI